MIAPSIKLQGSKNSCSTKESKSNVNKAPLELSTKLRIHINVKLINQEINLQYKRSRQEYA